MTPEEINAAIADGFTYPSIPKQFTRHIPDYYHDLNAIHGVVRQLDRDTKVRVILDLAETVDAWINRPEVELNEEAEEVARIALATPSQWCEAYLKAIGRGKR